MPSVEERERRQRWLNRRAFQIAHDRLLAGDPDAAQAVRDAWEPMLLFLKEGPDVGEPEEVESAGGQRFN